MSTNDPDAVNRVLMQINDLVASLKGYGAP